MLNSKVFERMAINLDSISVYRNVRSALGYKVTYMVAAGDRYPTIAPTITESLLDSMNIVSVNRYKFFCNGYYVDMPCNHFKSSFDIYRFYAYGIYGKVWKRRKLGIPTQALIIAKSEQHDISVYKTCKSIIDNTIINGKISSKDIYEYFKNNCKSFNVTKRKRNVKIAPNNTVMGLVHVDYYNGSLQIDKLNTTKDKETEIFCSRDEETKQIVSVKTTEKGKAPAKTNNATVDNFATLSRIDVIHKIKGKRLDSYNNRALMLMRRIMRTDSHVTDIRICYAKKYYKKDKYVKFALYAIVFKDNEKPSILYFDFIDGIAYSKVAHFKDGKVRQTDYVRLSKIKDRKIEIYANKLEYEKSHKHVA